MPKELIYTSAERGLRPGTRGFCTVAYTRGMSPALVRILESLSAYKALYADHDPRAASNPIAFSHYRYMLDGRGLSILSRIAGTGVDHTRRNNKIAHHLSLRDQERPEAGPAWLLSQECAFHTCWTEPPQLLESPPSLPPEPEGAEPLGALTWQQLTGDAGWAGELAQSCLLHPREPVYIVAPPDVDMLRLFAEALALLPVRKRWQVSFNTYFNTAPAGASCLWRGCVPDAECLRSAQRGGRNRIFDLGLLTQSAPSQNSLVETARASVREMK